MKYLKNINESKSFKEELSSLKDALVDISDERNILFETITRPHDSHWFIIIKIELSQYCNSNYYTHDKDLHDIENMKKSNEEIFHLAELVREGIERSQVEYIKCDFSITEEDNVDWEENTDDDTIPFFREGGEKECDVIDFRIVLKSGMSDKKKNMKYILSI